MRGIVRYGWYLPKGRLDRSAIGATLGTGGGTGTRSVAGPDEDTTTMGLEAARWALRGAPVEPTSLWFSTAEPAYLEKTNACAIHAAARLPTSVAAIDMGGAVRSGVGALLAALQSSEPVLTVSAGLRTGRPTSADEASGGDGAAAFLAGEGPDVIAELIGHASATEEFLDRWRVPGAATSKQWEERFGETRYVPLADRAWNDALKEAALTAADVDVTVLTGVHPRAAKAVGRRLGVETFADDLSSTIGNTGAAHPSLVLASVLDRAEPDTTIALVVLSDGVDVLIFRTTDAITAAHPAVTLLDEAGGDRSVDYPTFLKWRGMLEVEPPNRPLPARVSASAAARADSWKFGFVGAKGDESGLVHLPPARVSIRAEDTIDAMTEVPMADAVGTVVTFTVDRLAYSIDPPVIFAVVDFEGGGRLPMEITDVGADDVAIGDQVVPTFRRLFTADGIHNYFWKATPRKALR